MPFPQEGCALDSKNTDVLTSGTLVGFTSDALKTADVYEALYEIPPLELNPAMNNHENRVCN